MDLGLDRLIEMFEERFGRRVATILLFLVGLGVAGFALHSIYTTLLLPVADGIISTTSYVRGLKPLSFTPTILAQGAVGIIGVIALSVTITVTARTRKRIEKSFQAIRERLSDLEFEKRTIEQERDALAYFMNRAGGSSQLQLPSNTEPEEP